MRKEFNITGNCFPKLHYMADVSDKLTETIELIEKGKYFVINRPRQYGKTTTLYALAHALRQKGDYIALNMSFEAVGEDAYVSEMSFARQFLRLVTKAARLEEKPLFHWIKEHTPVINAWDDLSDFISEMIEHFPQKIVLLIDEVDQSSNNDIFIQFLAFLRNKFLSRNIEPTFHSVILAGVYDVKMLKMKISFAEKVRPDADSKLNSPWNIAAPFKVDMNLHPSEIKPMLADYIRETGVQMDTDLISYGLFRYTSGYPFLVSRLCKMLDEDFLHTKPVPSWTATDLEEAVRQLIKENNTNFETQIKNLENNPKLYDLIYALVIDGETFSFNIHHPMIQLAAIHGLLKEQNGYAVIHNTVYREVLINYMTDKLHIDQVTQGVQFGSGYRNPNKTLNMEAVLLGFQSLLKEQYSKNERDFLERQGRLVFLAFLRPILNGAGYDFKEVQVSEEKRLDVVITYYACKYVVELKRWYGPKLHEEGLLQLADYLEIQNLSEGYLVIFDNKKIKSWNHDTTIVNGKRIFMVWV